MLKQETIKEGNNIVIKETHIFPITSDFSCKDCNFSMNLTTENKVSYLVCLRDLCHATCPKSKKGIVKCLKLLQ